MKTKIMRKIFIFCVMLGLASLLEISAVNAASAPEIKDPPSSRVIVYYFHGNFRCASCRKIEQYTNEAIQKYFSKEIEAGKLAYKVVNVQQKENSHFVEDYQLYTRSVVASLVKDGREVKHETLAKVWEYLGNKQKFYNYIDEEVDKFLKEL
ncbi:MAG: nitrophenyl compound nitroreductase subunit ArsF family protein [Candidatus Omnitrophota bacterium]